MGADGFLLILNTFSSFWIKQIWIVCVGIKVMGKGSCTLHISQDNGTGGHATLHTN